MTIQENIMYSTITERGQTSVPAALRKRFHLLPNTQVAWMGTAEGIFVLPVPKDPVAAFRGQSSHLTTTLLQERQQERRREKTGGN